MRRVKRIPYFLFLAWDREAVYAHVVWCGDVGDALLRKHVLDFFVAEADFVDGVALAFEGLELVLDVGWEEDF